MARRNPYKYSFVDKRIKFVADDGEEHEINQWCIDSRILYEALEIMARENEGLQHALCHLTSKKSFDTEEELEKYEAAFYTDELRDVINRAIKTFGVSQIVDDTATIRVGRTINRDLLNIVYRVTPKKE